MMTLKSVGLFSTGKVLGIMYVVVGLLVGGFVSLGALAGMSRQGGGDPAIALFFGVGAIVVLPILYGVAGFVGGILGAAIYNVIASIVGGIEFEIVQQQRGQW